MKCAVIGNREHGQVPTSEIAAILNGIDAAVFVIDGDRHILFENKAAEELFGGGLEGENFVRALRHPDCLMAIDSVLGGKRKVQIPVVLTSPVKTTYRLTVTSVPEEDTGGAAAVVSFDDISHISEAEQMRSDFIANVSHELRSPLTALSGFIETLRSSAKDDVAARNRFLDTMKREAHRMNRLIDDLLSLSKVEVNEHVRPTDKVDLPAVIKKVTSGLSPMVEREKKTIRLETPEQRLDPVAGDEDQLTQVFQNLIENALKYGNPDTEVVIGIAEVESRDKLSDRMLAVDIADRGPGIPAKHIPRLTERFYRVDDSRSRDKGGTGLGLAIVKHIVNRHRGRLQIKSEQGVGSTFTVLLPIEG